MLLNPTSRNVSCLALLLLCVLPAGSCLPTGGLGGGDGSFGGGAGFGEMHLEDVFWGRLVDVMDVTGIIVEKDVVIRESLVTDANYSLARNPITGAETVAIQEPHLNGLGLENPVFASLLRAARYGLVAVPPNGPEANGVFARVARNGVIRLEFNDYLDPSTVNRQTVQAVLNLAVSNTRYIVKQGENSAGEAIGIIIVDPIISAYESAETGLPENGLGFSESADQLAANGLLRIPTVLEPLYGQTQILTNLAGNRTIGSRTQDPAELSDGGSPVIIRAFRSGNGDDPFRGFMVDMEKPSILAELDVGISSIADLGSGLYEFSYGIEAVNCQGISSKVGDVLEFGDAIVLVSGILGANPAAPSEVLVSGALAQGSLVVGDYSSSPLVSKLHTRYADVDAHLQYCWVRFTAAPQTLPAEEVDPYATVGLRFTEAVLPSSVKSLGTMVLHTFNSVATIDSPEPNSRPIDPMESTATYIDRLLGYATSGTGSGRIFLGPIEAAMDSRTFILAPSAGISNVSLDPTLSVALAIRDGATGILDLAGNPLDFSKFVAGSPGQEALFSLDPSIPPPDSRYFALRVLGLDENGDGLSEYTGQFGFEPGILRGRAPSRFSRSADMSNLYIGQRAPWSSSIMTPLTPAGAVLMTCWGYHHLGFGLTSIAEMDVDVEGMNWSPFGALAFNDVFDRYSIALSHSERLPDDYINPSTGYPDYDASGLKRNALFDKNTLGFAEGYYEKIVFDTKYEIDPGQLFQSERGSAMLPWPDFETTYTWRDTSFPEDLVGTHPDKSVGVPPAVTSQVPYWSAGQVPSAGLPLLARFRSYPSMDRPGPNGFQVQIMVPSSNRPVFRIFSYGGNGGALVVPDVGDSGTKPTGGLLSNGGGVQNGYGPELYWQQIDFVVRVSRVYTHWFSFGGVLESVASQVVDPFEQLGDAEFLVEWRGSEMIDVVNCEAQDQKSLMNDASSQIDYYGEFLGSPIHYDRLAGAPNPSCGTLSAPSPWTADPTALAAEAKWQFFQLRFTFVSDIENNIEAEMDAYGFAWMIQ